MQIKNPYTEKLHDAIRSRDKEKESKYRQLSSEYVSKAITDLESKMGVMEQKFREVKTFKTKKEQLQRARELNRVGRMFVERTIQLKREIRRS